MHSSKAKYFEEDASYLNDDVHEEWNFLRSQRPRSLSHLTSIGQNLFVMVPYLLALIFFLLWLSASSRTTKCADPSQGIYSPAQNAIKYVTKVFAENFETKGPYMGSPINGIPSKETDKLWEGLYQHGISRIDAESAARLPNRTTGIPTMPGQFVVELDVFHQLHCLNAIRKTLYPERYAEEFDDYFTADGQRNYTSTSAKHYDHCIDSIRQSLMCHGDIATVYWEWMPVRRQPLPRLEITHTCRDFDAISKWAMENQLLNDDSVLQYRPGPRESFTLSA